MFDFDFKDFRSRVDMDGLMGLGFRAFGFMVQRCRMLACRSCEGFRATA